MITRYAIWNGKEGLFLCRLGGFRQWTADFDNALLAPSEEVANEIISVASRLGADEQLTTIVVHLGQATIREQINACHNDLSEHRRLFEQCAYDIDHHPLTNHLIEKERTLLELVIVAIKDDINLLEGDLIEAMAASSR